jgi:hypothetical protein
MASLVKLKPFCKVFDKMTVVVASMSHVGKKPREATIFWLHLRSTNCKMASLGSRFFRGLAGLL